MNVRWSISMSTFVWDCMFGCSGFDYESRWEAEQAFAAHKCPMSC